MSKGNYMKRLIVFYSDRMVGTTHDMHCCTWFQAKKMLRRKFKNQEPYFVIRQKYPEKEFIEIDGEIEYFKPERKERFIKPIEKYVYDERCNWDTYYEI